MQLVQNKEVGSIMPRSLTLSKLFGHFHSSNRLTSRSTNDLPVSFSLGAATGARGKVKRVAH
jgi:hypothetical protein